MSSPTQRTLKELRRLGATAQVVEHWNAFSRRRVDLFGIIDIVACLGPNLIGIQCTSGTNHAARREKTCAEPRARDWLIAGGLLEIWSWAKRGERGKVKRWECRKEEIGLKDLESAYEMSFAGLRQES